MGVMKELFQNQSINESWIPLKEGQNLMGLARGELATSSKGKS